MDTFQHKSIVSLLISKDIMDRKFKIYKEKKNKLKIDSGNDSFPLSVCVLLRTQCALPVYYRT